MIAFSATSSQGFERMVSNCIAPPKVLRFKSEYELVHGSSPVQEAIIRSFRSESMLLEALKSDVEKNFDHRPIVIIHAEE